MNFLKLIVLSFILVLLAPNFVNANDHINVYINGDGQVYDQSPIIKDDRTLVPMRGIFEDLGSTVMWDGTTDTVTAIKGDTKVVLQIGSKTAFINEKTIMLDTAPIIETGRTLVPLRFVSESFGAQVMWRSETKSVLIFYNQSEVEYFNQTLIDQAKNGKLKNCTISFNTTARTILETKGTPEAEGSMGGSYYFTYEQCRYHVNFIDYKQEGSMDAKITAIDHLSESLIATPSEVKNKLGEPYSEGESELSGQWTMTYLTGDYRLILSFDNKQSAVTEIRLKENNMATLKPSLKHMKTADGDHHLIYSLENPLNKEQEVKFNSGQEYDYRLIQNGQEIEHYSQGRMFTQQLHSKLLQPGEELIYQATFDSLESGEYTIEFWLTSTSHNEIRQSLQFTVE